MSDLPTDTPERRQTVIAWALERGYECERTSLFDEEAVEGYAWFTPDGKEAGTVIGVWHEPPEMPDDLFNDLNALCPVPEGVEPPGFSPA